MEFAAVIFDLGGVVLGSPLQAIAEFEAEQGAPAGLVSRIVMETGSGGAWSRLERGELGLEEFYAAFDEEFASFGSSLSARALMACVHESAVPRPRMIEAVRRIRQRGMRAGALTNNWVGEDNGTSVLQPHFDVFVESSVVGMRKPDPRIYQHVCRELAIEPSQAAFLDDIGTNLKAARQLGMHTIKVTDPDAALAELETLLGFPLTD